MAVIECSRCEGVHYLSRRCHPDLLERAAAKRERKRIAKMLREECCCDVDWLCSYCKFAGELEGER